MHTAPTISTLPPLVAGTVCSGIGAPEVAMKDLNYVSAWSSEIEQFPCRVLAHHYPDTPNLGDMTRIFDNQIFKDANIDILIGGTPCQSFSIAGLRGGLDDDRGNLALVFARILLQKQPEWFVWENVPGVFSSFSLDKASITASLRGDSEVLVGQKPRRGKGLGVALPAGGGLGLFDSAALHAAGSAISGGGGRAGGDEGGIADDLDLRDVEYTSDFAGILNGFRECGYTLAYRVLDSQYFGVPQRRRRVFVVGHLGADWRPSAAVLLERDSLHRDLTPRREARQEAAASAGAGAEVSGGDGVNDYIGDTLTKNANQATGFCGDVGATLGDKILRESGQGYWMEDDRTGPLRNRGERPSYPSHAVFQNIGQHYTNTIAAMDRLRQVAFGEYSEDGLASSKKKRDHKDATDIITSYIGKSYGLDQDLNGVEENSGTLRAHGSGGSSHAISTPKAFGAQHSAHQGLSYGDVTPTLDKSKVPAVCFQQNGDGELRLGEIAGTLNKNSNASGRNTTMIHTHVARRLTPVECLRLQGFPDDHLDIPGASDSAKYAACGNSMTTYVMYWILRRISLFESVKSKLA